MTGLTVTAYTGSDDLLGKSVGDLQTGVTVGRSAVTGTLKYVDDYTGFSSNVNEQQGNYLVLHAAAGEGVENPVITAEIIGGDHGPVTLDPDGILIARIKNVAQKVKFTATADGHEPTTKTFNLASLILTPAG